MTHDGSGARPNDALDFIDVLFARKNADGTIIVSHEEYRQLHDAIKRIERWERYWPEAASREHWRGTAEIVLPHSWKRKEASPA